MCSIVAGWIENIREGVSVALGKGGGLKLRSTVQCIELLLVLDVLIQLYLLCRIVPGLDESLSEFGRDGIENAQIIRSKSANLAGWFTTGLSFLYALDPLEERRDAA